MKKKIIVTVSVLLALLVLASAFYDTRVNVLVMGVEGTRTDTMLFVSVSTKTNRVDVISIPRDTYYPTEGKNKLGQKKLNAVYGFKEIGGPEGVASAVSNILGVRIDHTVVVDYDAVKNVVDALGGVEVDVPFDMKYDDPYATPPLHIDFKAGVQTITGDNAIGYLRFRKSNDGKIREGDVQRIVRQQDFIIAAAKKAMSFKLPFVVTTAVNSVETDLSIPNSLFLALNAIGVNSDTIHTYTLPVKTIGTGSDGLSYFYHDPSETTILMQTIYADGLYGDEAETVSE